MKQVKNRKVHRPQKDPVKAAEEYGIDIPMLMANLDRTIAERFLRHQIALETYYKLSKSRKV
jgi:hypothetical protein